MTNETKANGGVGIKSSLSAPAILNSTSLRHIVRCAILCSWNHTMGPQVVHKWTPNEEPSNSPDSQKDLEHLVARILHPDALPMEDSFCSPRSKVLVQAKENRVAHARVLKDLRSDCPLALLLVYSTTDLPLVWSLSSIVEVALASTVKALSFCKTKVEDSEVLSREMKILNTILSRLSYEKTSLSLPPVPSPDASPDRNFSNSQRSRIRMGQLEEEKETMFLAKCLVSHLQMGCSLLLLEKPHSPISSFIYDDKNGFLCTSLSVKLPHLLEQFLSQEEKICTDLSAIPMKEEKGTCTFCPGMFLQTKMKWSDKVGDICIEDLLKSPNAPSVVDVSRRKVRQLSRPMVKGSHNHGVEVVSRGEPDQPISVINPCLERSQLRTVLSSDTGRLVTEFLDQWIPEVENSMNGMANDKGVLRGTSLFARHLRLKGALASKAISLNYDSIRLPLKNKMIAATTTRNSNNDKKLDRSSVQQWLLGIPYGVNSGSSKASSREADLRVILGAAEKYHPGLTDYLSPANP